MHKLKIHQLAKITFLTAFLAACGGTDAPLGGNTDLQENAKSTQTNAVDLPQIQMQDAAGAIITGFSYDAQAVATSVTEQLANAAVGQSVQAPQLAKAFGFIIKYKADVASHSMSAASAEALSKPSANSMSAMKAAGSKAGVQLSYGGRLALGAHTYKSDKFLSQADALVLAAAMKQADPSIEFVEPDYIFKANLTPNDANYTFQWHYGNSPRYGGSQYGISLPSAWNISNGTGAKVAVIDSGFTDHPDLLPNILPGYDFISNTYIANDGGGRDADAHDPGDGISTEEYTDCPTDTSSWHGTHVSGTVAAVTNNGVGVAGVAYGAKVVPVRVLGRCGGLGSDIADGIIWAAGGNVAGVPANPNPVHVINLSIGSYGACSRSMQTAIDYAVKVGVTVVVSAGNYTADASAYAPANCNNVIAVAATDNGGYRGSFSNYGAVVDIAAPGVSILSTINNGAQSPAAHAYAYYSGTSMAAPHVAGVAALLKVQNPARSHFDIEYLIKRSAYALGSKCTSCGTGLLDAYAALTASGTATPVFRLNNKSLPGAYLFTAYGSERDAAFSFYNFGVEGVAFHVLAAPAAGMSPVVRFRDKDTGAYLFSIYETEMAQLRTTYAYKFVEEGTSWYASKTPIAGWSPLYRFRNKLNGTYTFTAYESERAAMNTTYSATFVEEGIAYYIMP
jgi:serine protease